MLVQRKQEWQIPEQTAPVKPKVKAVLPNRALRGKCFFLAAFLLVMAIVATVQSEAVIRSGYTLVQLKSEASQLEKENELLRLEIAKLRAPQRIQAIATMELGMVVPQNVYCAVEPVKESAGAATKKDENGGLSAAWQALSKSKAADASRGL